MDREVTHPGRAGRDLSRFTLGDNHCLVFDQLDLLPVDAQLRPDEVPHRRPAPCLKERLHDRFSDMPGRAGKGSAAFAEVERGQRGLEGPLEQRIGRSKLTDSAVAMRRRGRILPGRVQAGLNREQGCGAGVLVLGLAHGWPRSGR